MVYLIIFLMAFTQIYSEFLKPYDLSTNKDEANPQENASEFNLKSFPSSVVHSVSVISGQFVETDKDYRVVCPIPLTYERGKDSDEFGDAWTSNLNDYVSFKKVKKENEKSHKYRLEYSREFGETLYFGTREHRHDFKDRLVDDEQLEQGFTNFNGEEVSAHSNLRNIVLHYDYKKSPNKVWIELGDGTRKYFEGNENWFSLKKIERPDGNAIFCDKEEYKAINKLGEVMGWLRVEESPKRIVVKGSDGRQVTYDKSDYYYHRYGIAWTFTGITNVNRSDAPCVNYTYYGDDDLIRCMRTKYLPDSRYTEYLYYTKGDYVWEGKKYKIKNNDHAYRRVKNINAPLGTDPSPKPMYTFWYNGEKKDEVGYSGGNTVVLDALGRKKTYHYHKRKLTKIEHFDDSKLAYTDELEWGREKEKENTNLKKRLIKDNRGNILLSKEIEYDERHNPIRETVTGNWRGYGFSSLQNMTSEKTYSRDKFNLLVKEKDEEKTVEYTYYPNTNKMASKIIKGNDGVLIRSFYEYDKNGVLSKETIDDGENYSERRIKKIKSNMQGLPVDVCEYYMDGGQEVLKTREINTYNFLGRLIKRELFDAANTLATVEEWSFDDMGNITLEKNALGVIIRRHYDLNGNLVRKEGPLPAQIEHYTYDFMNRLIRYDEKIGSLTLSTHYGYDLCGNRTYQIDRSGHKTTYEYNYLNQKVKSILPDGAVLKADYDIFGNAISEWDGEGNRTVRSYTSSNQPYHISFPDGSEEKYVYDLKGRVIKKFHKNGLVTTYERDSLGRVLTTIDEHDGKILSRTSATYNAFHCLTETDAAGITTTYDYNKAGQKIKEKKREHVIEFGYDSLGRLSHTYTDDNVSIICYDALNQVTEEKLVGIAGNTLSHIKKQYDATGHLIHKATLSERGWDIETYLYNERGELIEATNALGEKTLHHYEYSDDGLRHITVNSNGIRLITHLDYAGKITHYERQNAYGETIQKREFTYDFNLNKTKAIETVYEGAKATRTVTTLWAYDKCCRLISITDGSGTPEQKKTSYIYNAYGQKSALIKPDGVVINYAYDQLGRQIQITSSDNTINQSFVYDALNQVIEAKDNHHIIKRGYDGTDLIVEQMDDQTLQYAYDNYGRLLTLTYPDQSKTHYSYLNGRINEVTRKNNKTAYTYSLAGKPSTITHFDNSQTHFTYDSLNRITKIVAPDYTETLIYDSSGNLIRQNDKSFTYDSLNQITTEDKATYAYDSRYNCISRNGIAQSFNALDELQSSEYAYDRNGNLIKDHTTTYRYDALDRLIEARTPSSHITYTYDPFNRRLTANDTRFIYQGDNEIGSVCPTHTSLRVLGVGNGAENSAATLFELDSQTYLPIHDHLGSLVRLIQNNKAIESHSYTAFGQSSTSSISPWRFSSKRLDPETNLIYFGRRYYNPTLQRWLTCDPKGYDGGPNLYAYCLNSPLSHIDLYGLVGISNYDSSCTRPQGTRFFSNMLRLPGLFLELIGQNFIPIPLIRDAIEYSGHVLAGRGLNNYTMSYRKNHTVEGVMVGIKDPRNRTHHMTNGIFTTYDSFMKQVEQYQRENNGVDVHYVYNGSKGLITDLLECGVQKLGIQTDADRAFVKHINNTVNIYGPNNKMLISAHSQGGMIVGNSLYNLAPDVRANMHVRTIGSASMISDKHNLGSITNYVSKADIVPLTDPIGHIKNLFGKTNITYLNPESWMIPDHFIDGKTYIKASRRIKYDFDNLD